MFSKALEYLNELKGIDTEQANRQLEQRCGIVSFFDGDDFDYYTNDDILREREFGDFQTNDKLCLKICKLIEKQGNRPKILIEPTCGKGGFIYAALRTFSCLETIVGVEIHRPYINFLKLKILQYYIDNAGEKRVNIRLICTNIFDFDFTQVKSEAQNRELLIIGNPPWVTNSALCDSTNLPKKSNFKQEKGIDAITGKGNFDIGEYITLRLIDEFCNLDGSMAFLVKNSVIKNVVVQQRKSSPTVGEFKQYSIDAKREFNASVDASLFLCKLNSNERRYQIDQYYLENNMYIRSYGWVDERMVSDIDKYKSARDIEGKCKFEWRQGVKHDCSMVMEFERSGNGYVNNLQEKFEIEDELVYGLLKSSDLKGETISQSRKYTIITQRKIGDDTVARLLLLPKTNAYLISHLEKFNARKSIIYKNKPLFSIFGIGEYSFTRYKVAISGLYKQTKFSLIMPSDSCKGLMLDDTCYFIGFDDFDSAHITQQLLNGKLVQDFLTSIIFFDSKRAITKDILQRIDLGKVISATDYSQLRNVTSNQWNRYKSLFIKQQLVIDFGLFSQTNQHITIL